MGYFGARAAPMGAVSAGVVNATFFNFAPEQVRPGRARRVGLRPPRAARARCAARPAAAARGDSPPTWPSTPWSAAAEQSSRPSRPRSTPSVGRSPPPTRQLPPAADPLRAAVAGHHDGARAPRRRPRRPARRQRARRRRGPRPAGRRRRRAPRAPAGGPGLDRRRVGRRGRAPGWSRGAGSTTSGALTADGHRTAAPRSRTGTDAAGDGARRRPRRGDRRGRPDHRGGRRRGR